MTRSRTSLRVVSGIAAAALVATALTGALTARADTSPPVSGTPVTVSSDPLPTTQVDGVVWAQVVVGGTVYVGGQFTTARPAGAAAGTQTVTRSNFLAYDLSTGALLPFAPTFNAQIRALTVSPDQKTLYVGGDFTTVNGAARYRVVAFDVASGAVRTSFAVTTNSKVYGLAATASRVYLAGIFTSVNNQTRVNAAAVDAATGAVQPFAVTPTGGSVRQVAVSPDGTKAVLAGNFTTLNGSSRPGYGMAMVNATTGASLALPANSLIRNGGTNAAFTSLTSAGGAFYVSGYRYTDASGNLEGVAKVDWATGNLLWLDDCHGDTYSVAVATDDLYVAGHPHDCSDIGSFPDTLDPTVYHRALAFTVARTGVVVARQSDYYDFRGQPAPSVLHWFPDLNAGTYTGQSQGPWSVAVGGSYVVYGGEFTKVNGKAQQGLVRFARPTVAVSGINQDGPVVTGTAFPVSARSSFRRAVVSWPADWDRDNTRLTYTVLRDGVGVRTQTSDSTFWTRPTLSYTDSGVTAGRTYTYQVRAADPYGNTAVSAPASVTISR